MYVPVRGKLALAMAFAISWVAFSLYVALPWINDLAELFSLPVAWFIVAGIALIPGWANAFLVAGLLIDHRPRYFIHEKLPPVTLLIAAYNEEGCIGDTLRSVADQDYPGDVEVLVIDDGSTDRTREVVAETIGTLGAGKNFSFRLIPVFPNGGKANALNVALAQASHDLIASVDADTHLFKDALARIVTNIIDGPAHTAAVAGTVLARNSRNNMITKLQEWDYFLGISVVKRIQSLYQGTLVSQGAFSVYRREALEKAGGWADTVGEDIVLTWAFHELGYRVGYAENAFVFTNVPETYGQFFRQRKRWARGLMEAFRFHPRIFTRPRMITPFIYLNALFPYLDLVFLCVFLPGVFAAVFFQYYAIVGVMTLLLLPLMLLINVLMFFNQRRIFRRYGLKVRKNFLGLILYMLTYQVIMSPASILGYFSEFFHFKKSWGTK
ncbi:glycosyltransferase [uncultured Desulfuromonas sp.]|uniref:glycosyltransferase n=1 Tax=uncultured Desulfuromonas sp. TaxID=181013 RepID=UPI002610B9C5|nr:glycosyltransferase [uncultured Desulfuromonas sp.]